jgi:phosphatidate cytidylyltransferase
VTRFLSGVVLLAAVGAAAWLAPPAWLLLLALVVVLLASLEYAALCRGLGAAVATPVVVSISILVCLAAAWPDAAVPPVLMAAAIVAAAGAVASGRPDRATLAGVAATAFAPLYLALPLGSLINLRWIEGREAAVLPLLVVVASDTSQYYAGRWLGRRPLAPSISPKKTVEGAIGGLVGAAVVFTALGIRWLPGMPVWALVALGVTLALLGIAGDLFESSIKRAASMKDSSALIPGHGGMLDRIDALLVVAPVYFVAVRYGGGLVR